VVGGVVALVATIVLGGTASADSGAYLQTGDVVCTDRVRTDGNIQVLAAVVNGSGTLRVYAADAGGAETEIWSASGPSLWVNRAIAAPAPGRTFRSCLTITRSFVSTWYRLSTAGYGPDAQNDLGPDTAVLSPGARACGDSGDGPVRLTGSAGAPVHWAVFGHDLDYGSLGEIFGRDGATIGEVFTPGPDVSLVEMCATNTSAVRVTVQFELSPA
jgi:hypothetical protein